MAFFLYKLLVFKTKNNWLNEYLRCYLTYSIGFILNIFIIWILVDKAGINIWISQACLIPTSAMLSYLLHDRFTFGINK